jgi:fatty-acyl-CoA synthase
VRNHARNHARSGDRPAAARSTTGGCGMTAPDFAARRAALSPDAVAFVDYGTGRSWSFAAVDAEAGRLAAALARDHAPGARIGILSHNRAEVFVALFAGRKAGLLMVPLNWRMPPAELIPLVQGIGVAALIHDAAHAATAAALVLPCLAMAEAGGFPQCPASTPPARPLAETAAWYLLLTSGTTGRPKAVIQTPRMALASAVNCAQHLGLSAADTGVSFLPLFHTAGINLFALPIFLWGGCSHVLPRFDAGRVLAMIGEGRVTQVFGLPGSYRALRQHPDFGRTDLARVRGYACGGAALPAETIRFFADRGAVICNSFGMTETGPVGFLLDRAAVPLRIGSVGKPQLLTEARLAGLPEGAAGEGELELGGASMTPGYFGDAQATAAAFTPDGWLRSGDIARRDADGFYTIIDRIKDMFVSGGENVYPAEIERVLETHPAILEAAVVGQPDPYRGEVGRAYLLPRPGQRPDLAALPAWCRERLAPYKVPQSFRLVEDFPRTADGKIQKRRLGEPPPG